MTYTGNDNLFIKKVIVCTEEPGTGLTRFGFKTDSTCSGGVSTTAINLNRSSAITSETTILENGDGTTLNVTGGFSVTTIRLAGPGTYEVGFKNAYIMSKNDSFAVNAVAATAGTKTRATILYFEEE